MRARPPAPFPSGRAGIRHRACILLSRSRGECEYMFQPALAFGNWFSQGVAIANFWIPLPMVCLVWFGLVCSSPCLRKLSFMGRPSWGVAIADFRIWSNPCLRKLAFTGRRHRQFLDALAYVSVCPCVRLPVCRSARLSVCLSISLSVLFRSLLLSPLSDMR